MGDWHSKEGMAPYERTNQHTAAHAFDDLATLLLPHDTDDTMFASVDARAVLDDTIFNYDDTATLLHPLEAVPLRAQGSYYNNADTNDDDANDAAADGN